MNHSAVVLVVLVVMIAAPLRGQQTERVATTPAAGEKVIVVTRSEAQSSRPGPAENFTGSVRVDQYFQATAPGRASGGRVTFEPGARTAWHAHPLGQTLIVTSGVGRVQRWGDPVDEIRPGDVVWIPPGQKHWHGASPTTSVSHIAIGERLDGKSVDWMEKVSDEQYAAPLRPRPAAAAVAEQASAAGGASPAPAGQPTRAQQIMGDFAPKLAQLTDDVLYADVWARPQLSPRDRSLVTVSALVALNRPDQLRSHLALARDNGVTADEVAEAITHLAFYAGWPSAVTAVTVAKEVFREEVRETAGGRGSATPSGAKAEQEIITLSQDKWRWMAERNVEALDEIFADESVFVHMGGTMTKGQELEVIRSGRIQYKDAQIQEVSVRFVGTTAILLSRIRLVAVVGGNEVVNPFTVTEVYVQQKGAWKVASLSFTRLLTP